MATKTAGVEVFTPRPRNDQKPLHEQLLTSCSSTDSTTADSILPSPVLKNGGRGRVKFAEPASTPKCAPAERIKVDEVDDVTPPRLEEKPARSARSRSRSSLRNATGPRSASRPARRRALSRGRPISRETTDDQDYAAAMTPDEIARELRPESFTRFKKTTLASDKKSSLSRIGSADGDLENLNFEIHGRGVREQLEQDQYPSNDGFIEASSPATPNIDNDSDWKQPDKEK